MKYTVKPSTKFQKDVKRIQRRGYDISLLTEIIKKLAMERLCLRKTRITTWVVTTPDAENVISLRIGC